MKTKEIVKKWYCKIDFPSEYDEAFFDALERYEIDSSETVESYDLNEEDGTKK